MKYSSTALVVALVTVTLGAAVSAEDLETRIDFGASSILGQANDAGAIYLSHRKQNDISSLLSMRLHYRNEMLADFRYGEINPETGLPWLPAEFIEDEQYLETDPTNMEGGN